MSSPPTSDLLSPYLNRIIKNSSHRKHSSLISSCKSALDPSNSETPLLPLILALNSSSPKLAQPALDASLHLFSLSLLRAELPDPSSSAAARLLSSICSCTSSGDESLELSTLRVLVAAVRSTSLFIRGECLVQIVKSCYNVCLGSLSAANQVCAKVALVGILRIVFARVEVGDLNVEVKGAVVGDLGLGDLGVGEMVRGFVEEAMGGVEEEGERVWGGDGGGGVREDGFVLFKSLCKFSMKFGAAGEGLEDAVLLRGKVLSLEMLRVVMESAGGFWLGNER